MLSSSGALRVSLLHPRQLAAVTASFWPQTRGLIILKRRYRIPQDQLLHPAAKLHRPRLQTYEIVEDTDPPEAVRKPLQLVLKQFIEGVGYAGDVVEMEMDQKTRYELLLPGLADYASPEALEWARQYREKVDVKRFSSLVSPRIIRLLRDTLFSLDMNSSISWRVEKWHIRTALRCADIHLSEDALTLPEEPIEGPENALNKDFVVRVTINGKDEAWCRFRIRSAQSLFNPTTLLEDSELPWFLEEPVPYFESQRAKIEELHKAVAEAYRIELERLSEAGAGI